MPSMTGKHEQLSKLSSSPSASSIDSEQELLHTPTSTTLSSGSQSDLEESEALKLDNKRYRILASTQAQQLPWWHCALADPYERINVWSHGLPGIILLIAGCAMASGAITAPVPLVWWCLLSSVTHLMSSITHIWPEDKILEKMDHIGILCMLQGTPFTAIMAVDPSADFTVAIVTTAMAFLAAFLPPLPRTASFIAVGAINFVVYSFVVNMNMVAQVTMYTLGGVFFVRNNGHKRLVGLQDHHLLHYLVSVACVLHVVYILRATRGLAEGDVCSVI